MILRKIDSNMQRYIRTAFLFCIGLFCGMLIDLYSNIDLNYNYCKIEEIEQNKTLPNEKNIIYTKCNYNRNGPRILCAVFTHAKVHSKVHYVHNTWGKRCDKVIYMTGPKQPGQNDDPNFQFVYLNMTDQYNRITEKALLTFEYIYDNLMEEFDWLVRANDDTYIIMENLKAFLSNRCSDDMSIYGKVLRHTHMSKHYNAGDNSKGFLQGGTGVIISREALRLFVKAYKNDSQFCVMFHGGFEDQEIANCFRKINIYPGDTRDEVNRERFFMEMFHQIWEKPSDVYSSHSINKVQLGKECCSDTSIGFHDVKDAEHYKMDFFLYTLRTPPNYTYIKI